MKKSFNTNWHAETLRTQGKTFLFSVSSTPLRAILLLDLSL